MQSNGMIRLNVRESTRAGRLTHKSSLRTSFFSDTCSTPSSRTSCEIWSMLSLGLAAFWPSFSWGLNRNRPSSAVHSVLKVDDKVLPRVPETSATLRALPCPISDRLGTFSIARVTLAASLAFALAASPLSSTATRLSPYLASLLTRFL